MFMLRGRTYSAGKMKQAAQYISSCDARLAGARWPVCRGRLTSFWFMIRVHAWLQVSTYSNYDLCHHG